MADLSELITVLVVTSPVASDPSTDTIDETIASVRAYDDLANVRLLIGCDGVRPEQRDQMREGWSEPLSQRYAIKKDLISFQLEQYRPAGNLHLGAWGHQANVMRALLAEVRTPLVLFMEHDTPFTPDVQIDWLGCAQTLIDGELDLIRFHHESHVLPEHAHLMIGDNDQRTRRIPYLRTVQWSQRPHLARTDWYRNLVSTYFAPSSRGFIEDVMHTVVVNAWNQLGEVGWQRFKLALYSDMEPTMQRTFHLDGRAGGDKYEQVMAYPGDEWPEFAPAPTLGKVFE